MQVYWTKEVGEAITTEGYKGLSKYGEKCTAELNKIVSLVRGQLTSLERAICGALVVIDVHARDVTLQVGSSCLYQPCLQISHDLFFIWPAMSAIPRSNFAAAAAATACVSRFSAAD